MNYSFEDLIKQFGVPKIIVPNTPYIRYHGGGNIGVGSNPEMDVPGKVYHRRFKHGDTEFLAVKSRIETYTGREKFLLEHLRRQNLNPVEFVYRFKGSRTWDHSTDDWKESKVAIATGADVEPLSREDLLRAIGEQRVLWVCGWSSMGDKYVDFNICSAEFLPKDQGYHFLFAAPCRLTGEMLVAMGDNYEWEEEFFNYHSRYFSREFFSDK